MWKKSDLEPRLTCFRLRKSEIVVHLIDYLGFRALRPAQSEGHLGFLPDEAPIARVRAV